ncbi:uncharacterized protein MYCFIDRAFT_169627 [Pseudocercospora fijiensis CIRAD86]|uniref:Uncharacterized protein n=1 Tax=Pseudocercospora fijiensis (strain CIRAD86) TaxID=383855 RepID=N1Q6D7_PSEFD|nr:uncharacterized protein MYCFIDRAFT_169627 [Pseudocercospora fijiensis CIRAD86]EME87895.1 hypothetical protein MYCFIDRAFT_169627 [Pseudocercospora fijiensis CIRAD86]
MSGQELKSETIRSWLRELCVAVHEDQLNRLLKSWSRFQPRCTNSLPHPSALAASDLTHVSVPSPANRYYFVQSPEKWRLCTSYIILVYTHGYTSAAWRVVGGISAYPITPPFVYTMSPPERVVYIVGGPHHYSVPRCSFISSGAKLSEAWHTEFDQHPLLTKLHTPCFSVPFELLTFIQLGRQALDIFNSVLEEALGSIPSASSSFCHGVVSKDLERYVKVVFCSVAGMSCPEAHNLVMPLPFTSITVVLVEQPSPYEFLANWYHHVNHPNDFEPNTKALSWM